MKKILLPFLFLFISTPLLAQNQPLAVEGLYAVGSIERSSAGSTLGISAKYWGDVFGGQFGLAGSRLKADSEGVDLVDESEFLVFGSLNVGYSIENFKPFLSLGLLYSNTVDDIANITINGFEFTPSIGVDIQVTEHLMLGFTGLGFNIILNAEAESNGVTADINGSTFQLLSGMHVAYRF